LSNLRDSLAERLAIENLKGVERARKAVRFALSRRDRALPLLAETRNFTIQGPGGPLPARFYVPQGVSERSPLLVFFHGGGFILGDIETHDAFCVRLADAARVRIVSARYRLAPEAPFPAQVEDAEAAFRWIATNAADFGAEGQPLALGGDSAGGYLAVATTVKVNAETPGAVAAQVLVYPLMTMDDELWASTLFQDSRIVGRLAVQFIRAQLAASHLPSLLGSATAATPPTLIVAGGQLDPCRPEAVAYAEELRRAGVAVEERYYPVQPHGFINLTHVTAQAREAVTEIGEMTGALLRGL
jgi:acetyl esterase